MTDAGLAVARPRPLLRRVGAPHLALGVVILVWSLGPLINRGMHAHGTVAGFYRMWMAVPVCFAVARWRRTPVTWTSLRHSAPAGALFVSAYIVSYESLHRTTVANSSLIGALQPVIVMLAALPLFGERIGLADVRWTGGALAGVAVFVLSGHGGGQAGLTGDLLAVVSLVLWSAYFLEMKRNRSRVPVAAFLAGVFTTGSVLITPYAIATGADVASFSLHDALLMLAMVLLPGMMGHGLMTWVQRHVEVGLAVTLTLASTVLTAVGAWILFAEPLGPAQVAGGALVLTCLAGLVQHRNRANAVGRNDEPVLS